VTVIGDEFPLAEIPPQVAVNVVIWLPPFELGEVNAIDAWVLPAVAVPIVGAPGTVPTIPKDWVTFVAAKYWALPDWLATIVQVPSETIESAFPETVHTFGVFEESTTDSPDVAEAVSVTVAAENDCVPGFVKLIDWLACPETVNVNAWVGEPLALVAVTVNGNVPDAVGVPESTPVDVFNDAALMPAGNDPEILKDVAPGATNVNVLAVFTAKVAVVALVNTGAKVLFKVKDALIACSVGTVV
jgi:hypothetical protein